MPSADQLIYTRATAAYSPTGVEGFQVVHRSAGLTEEDVQQITPLVESIPDSAGQERRLLFFRLADGRIAVSLAGVVATDPKITDAKRKSALLSHTLVVDARDFTYSLQNQPFELLDQGALWVTSPKEMERKFARQGAIVSPANVDRDQDSYAPQDTNWSAPEWKKLVTLAKNAQQLVAAGKTVFLRGSPDEAATVLRALLPAVSSKKRAACTFDTACAAESFRPGVFWAVAGTFPPPGADCVEVDLDAKQVQLENLNLDLGLDMFERWVTAALDSGNPGKIARFGPAMEVLVDTLQPGRELATTADLDAGLLREFYDTFPNEVAADLNRRLNGWLTKRLADGLKGYLEHAIKTAQPPWWLSQAESEAGLSDWLAEWIARAQPALGRADRAKLRELGARPGARALAFWGLSTGFWPKHGAAREVLGAMTDAEFATAVRLLGHTIPAARFVHAKHLPAFVAAIARAVIPEKELLNAVAAVLREGRPKALDPLAERIAGLSAAGVQRLDRELSDSQAGDTACARAVTRRMAPQSPDRFPAAQPG